MILDKQTTIVDGLLLSAIDAASTTLATAETGGNALSLPTFGERLGEMQINAFIHGEDCAGGTSLRLILYVSSAPTAKTNAVAIADSGVIATATMKKGYVFPMAIHPATKLTPSGGSAPAYIITELIQAGTAFTGNGKLTIALVPKGDQQTAQV